MFDNITVSKNFTLPELPQCVLDKWKSQENIMFQTKSFDYQCLDVYHIDETGKLKKRFANYEWHDGDPDGDSFVDRLGHNVETESWWEDTDFTGCVSFYEYYDHPDRGQNKEQEDNHLRYSYGWVEYSVVFYEGKMQGEIVIEKHESPVRYSEEEVEKRKQEQQHAREETAKRMIEYRKNYPTPEQKLIDQIYEETNIKSAIIVQEDIGQALSRIHSLIESYRQKHDLWYE
jgi:hypothetical protein